NYQQLLAGKPGILFFVEGSVVPRSDDSQRLTVHKFNLEKRKSEKFVESVTGSVYLSHNGDKLLYRQDNKWFLAGTADPPKLGKGALKVETMEVRVDPRAEWQQM